MTVESVTNIDDLNPAYPDDADNISEGNNHIQNIKTALTNNFANIGGNVTATHTELNYLAGLTLGTVTASKAVTADSNKLVKSLLLDDASSGFADTSDTTKDLFFSLGGATTAKTMTITSSHTDDRTLTLPDATDTLVGLATTDTLTNKTLNSPVLNTGVSGTAFIDDDTMATVSATTLCSGESIKAYVDNYATNPVPQVQAVQATSGAGPIEIATSIPSGCTHVEIAFGGVSASGTDEFLIQLKDSAYVTSGYSAEANDFSGQYNPTSGIPLIRAAAAAQTLMGILTLKEVSSNEWVAVGQSMTDTAVIQVMYGTVTLSSDLTAIRVDTSGSNTFDGGNFRVTYY